MQILVFGTTGQVARELQRRAPAHGVSLRALGRAEADLTNPEACAAAIAGTGADAVINAAAHTAVDRAESEPDVARTINADAPGAMARAAAARGLPFVHVSTDYVFDGAPGRAWLETDPTGPLGVYGKTKLAGEAAVADAGGSFAVLRTSWVFSAHGGNFLKTMLRLGAEREELKVVEDQIGGPTPAGDIAGALLRIATAFGEGRGKDGIFHFSGAPAVSWADFARAIFEIQRDLQGEGVRTPAVHGIPSSGYPTPARRPLNSVLDCTAIAQAYGIPQPDWRAGVADVIRELS